LTDDLDAAGASGEAANRIMAHRRSGAQQKRLAADAKRPRLSAVHAESCDDKCRRHSYWQRPVAPNPHLPVLPT
jgi:hypothetical protein